jgi:hypothetical protein
MTLSWLQSSVVGIWVSESEWGYPIAVTSHSIGMAIVVGVVLMFDLRVLGFAKELPARWFERLFPIAWVGFALNLVSGVALFCGNPDEFLASAAFQIKLVLILAGGFSLWFLARSMGDGSHIWEPQKRDKAIAGASFCFWAGAIIAGRLIAYTT